MVKLSSYVIHIVLLIFIVSRLTPPFGEYGAIKRYYLKKNNNNNNNLNKSKHELLCFVVSVPCSAKLPAVSTNNIAIVEMWLNQSLIR